MKEEYWKEMLSIFVDREELKREHHKLYETISLIVKTTELHKELEELNKHLTELNSSKNN